MTIHVTPEPDGSFTVSCGSETITVGIPGRIGVADDGSGPIRWPDAPEGNPHGVRAYLAVGAPRRLRAHRILGAFRIDVSSEDVENTDDIERYLQRRLLQIPGGSPHRLVELQVTVAPGRPLDIASLMCRLNGLAERSAARIVVYIEAGAGGVAGQGV